MWYAMAGFVVVIVIVVLALRRRRTPSAAMFLLIRDKIKEIQCEAMCNVLSEAAEKGVPGLDFETMQRQTVTLDGVIRFIYTVERLEDDFLHLVSSQLTKAKPSKYQIQCMLVVMLELHQQLKDAGINPEDARFSIEASELGTQYIGMTLAPDQHAAFAASLTAARAS